MHSRPAPIAHAVHSGHRYARELDSGSAGAAYRRDAPIMVDATRVVR